MLRVGDAARHGRRRGSGGGARTGSETGRSRGPPGVWAARIDAWCRCEAGRGVSGIRRSTTARKFDGGAFSPDLRSGAIPPRRGPRPSVEAPGRVLVLRRGYCAAWPGLRCIGVAWPRRRRGAARGGAAWRRLLGFATAFGVGVRVQGGPLGPIKGRAGSGRPCRGARGRGSRREPRLG